MLQALQKQHMHSLSPSLVHRGSGVASARTRWQPYLALMNQPSQHWITNTPASPAPSTSHIQQAPTPPTDICTPLPQPCLGRPPLRKTASVRDLQKTRHIHALVDYACKSLDEIWQPQDIPTAFTSTSTSRPPIPMQTASLPSMGRANFEFSDSTRHRNSQLPSPLTPSTTPSITPSPMPNPIVAPARPSSSSLADTLPPTVVPIRNFVVEVLKRSKTSAGVLQTALCYIEAIRAKVPVLFAQEQMGLARHGEPDLSHVIVKECDLAGDEASYDMYAELDVHSTCDDMLTETVKVVDDLDLPATPASPTLGDHGHTPSATWSTELNTPRRTETPQLTPLPPLPSPLLCPRRTFLAAIILASKFMQDKSFSNKAWARLAGLPAREIGRCERALGAALEWRLWVGKLPVSATAQPAPSATGHLANMTDVSFQECARASRTGLGRCRTVPASGFGSADMTMTMAPPVGCGSGLPSSSSSWMDSFVPEVTYQRPDCFVDANSQPSPASMSTPGLTHSPASSMSSGGPTPHWVDFVAPSPSPAILSFTQTCEAQWTMPCPVTPVGNAGALGSGSGPGPSYMPAAMHPRVEALLGRSVCAEY